MGLLPWAWACQGELGGTAVDAGPTEGLQPSDAQGIFDCPTAVAPAYNGASDSELSAPFRATCGACHGTAGEGSDKFPELPGSLSFTDFQKIVRDGTLNMPSFDGSEISDEELENDYELLTTKPREALLASQDGEWSWSEQELEEIYTRGMEAWRKPDAEGAACANCHSPDALDLAVIAYDDANILRRAHPHISNEDALAVRDLVHAQRRRFNITRPCDITWHPLQPGGTPLPGDTPDEQDEAFARELVRLELFAATGTVRTVEDAHRLATEMAGIDLKRLRIGIPLPRWTEDQFRGEEHRTIDDHLAGVPHVPMDPSWYASMDAYVQDPTDAALLDLLSGVSERTTDVGFVESTPVIDACGYERAGGFIAEVSDAKYRGLLVMQHFFRQALLDRPGWFEQGRLPFADRDVLLNPWFKIGGENAERRCPYPQDDSARPVVASTLPKMVAAELSPSDIADGDFLSLTDDMAHHWMTLGQIFDPTLFKTEPQVNNKLNYWVGKFTQREVHLPFFYFHRVFSQSAQSEANSANPASAPLVVSWHGQSPAHPLLDFARLQIHNDGTTGATSLDKSYADIANRLRGNLYRAVLLLQKERLEAGEGIFEHAADCDQQLCASQQLGPLGSYFNQMEEWKSSNNGTSQFGALAPDIELYTTDSLALHAEVVALVEKAPRLE